MTDKELRKLKRRELLELMYYLKKELEDVKLENEDLRKQLEDKAIAQSDVNDDILAIIKRMAGQVDSLCKEKGSNDTKSKETRQ
jgi:hypothetical protein